MRRSFKFFSFWLLLLGTVTVIFNSCGNFLKNKSTYDEGVIINDVKWATCNVDKPGRFTAKPEDAGMFYQWNKKKAWSAKKRFVKGWDDTLPKDTEWIKANDPSPKGWRVPTFDEIKTLFDTNKVSHEWTTINGVNGRKFTDKTSGNILFLPAIGCRDYHDGTLYDAGTYGSYWSSMRNGSYGVYELSFGSTAAGWYRHNWSFGFGVRAVAK